MWTWIKRNRALIRALSVVGMVATLVTGVTYAALQSPSVNLTGNSIHTATANLLIGTTSSTANDFAASRTGFDFAGLIPGAPEQPADSKTFYLKNTGTAPLTIKLSISGTPDNTNNVDLSAVVVNITNAETGDYAVTSLADLINDYPDRGLALPGTLAPSSSGTAYTINLSMKSDAFTGNSASIGGFDFVFTGIGVAQPAQ